MSKTYAQVDIPTKDGSLFYEKVTTKDSSSKSELYLKAKMWLSSIYKNSKNVVEVDDKDAGKLVSKGYTEYSLQSGFKAAYANFTIAIDVKDNRFRIQFYDFTIKRSKRDFNGIDQYYSIDVNKDLAEYKSGKGKKADNNVFEILNTKINDYIIDFDKKMSQKEKDDF